MPVNKQDHTLLLNTCGLHCPQPVIHCKAILASMDHGEVLYMIATDCDAPREIGQLVRHTNNRLQSYRFADGKHHFYIEKKGNQPRRHIHANKPTKAREMAKFLQRGIRKLHRWIFLAPLPARV